MDLRRINSEEVGHAMNDVLAEANDRIKFPAHKLVVALTRPRVRDSAVVLVVVLCCCCAVVCAVPCCAMRNPHTYAHARVARTLSPIHKVGVARAALPARARRPVRAHLRQHPRARRAARRRDRAVGVPRAPQRPQDGCASALFCVCARACACVSGGGIGDVRVRARSPPSSLHPPKHTHPSP